MSILWARVCSVKNERSCCQEKGTTGTLKTPTDSWLSVTEQGFQRWEMPKLSSRELESATINVLYLFNISTVGLDDLKDLFRPKWLYASLRTVQHGAHTSRYAQLPLNTNHVECL